VLLLSSDPDLDQECFHKGKLDTQLYMSLIKIETVCDI
jgi:hypothetical protein